MKRSARQTVGPFPAFCRGLAVVLVGLALLMTPPAAEAAAKKRKSTPNNRYASLVMDADTGQIISQSNADKKLHPASLTKVMTLLMVFEAVEDGRLSLRERIPVSILAANQQPSKLGLRAGTSIRVEDAIYALVTKSANDVAVAVGEKLGGTESRFAMKMTERARALGMNSTTFRNASGLHDPRQISSARDMARLAHYIITNYPQYYSYFSTRNFSYQGVRHHNHNRLMETYRGMDGMKTGYIVASGFNLIASARRDDRRLIGVVFGGRSAASRNAHMASLLDQGFAQMGRPATEAPRIASLSPSVALPEARLPVIPPRKPQEIARLNALRSIMPASGAARLSTIGDLIQEEAFGGLIGQGDYESAAAARNDSALMARAPLNTGTMMVSSPDKNWSVQIGAFSSRVKTDEAIRAALRRLPSNLADAQPTVVPAKTVDGGFMFRGRLNGYSEREARAVCTVLNDCLPVAPAGR